MAGQAFTTTKHWALGASLDWGEKGSRMCMHFRPLDGEAAVGE